MNQYAQSLNRLPDFFIIGAAKSGTSSLYAYLKRHPDIFMPDLKEPEFFSKETVYKRGIEWYENLFLNALNNQLCGEASTTYSRWPHTLDSPKLIADLVPNAKFIYIMRHPIDRSYSHYGHHMREGITMSFEEALKKSTIYIDCSMYMDQINRYLRFFQREQFLFLFQNDLKKNPRILLNKIINFLGLKKIDLTLESTVRNNVRGPDHFIRAKTTKRIRQIPSFDFLADRLPQNVKNRIYTFIRKSFVGQKYEKMHHLEPMKSETRQKLIKIFDPMTNELEHFLNIKIDSWRK
jgi:hypothetical protein